MASEDKKDFNAMLNKANGMPKIQQITDPDMINRYGGERMFFAPPAAYDALMRRIPAGFITTISELRTYLARTNNADFTDPITAGIFVSIAAWASFQRTQDKTPYWRTCKANGELNPKYPGGIEAQREKLEAESLCVVQKGRTKPRWFVKDYEQYLYAL